MKNSLSFQFPVHKVQLNNGLKAMIIEDDSLPIICSTLTFNVGGQNLHNNKTGIAHLFEHMMFNGSKKYPNGQFDSILESQGGYSNAWTSRDFTSYFEMFPSKNIETILDMNRDRVQHLELTDKMLTSEKEVVKEERRMAVDDSIQGSQWEILYKNAFKYHTYKNPILGWMDDIASINLDDCQSFYEKYYASNNAILVLAGNIEAKYGFELIEQYYGNIQPFSLENVSPIIEPKQTEERYIHLEKPTKIEHLLIGYHSVNSKHEQFPVFDILQYLLSEGESSRLYKRLVYEHQITINCHANFHWGKDNELITFGFTVQNGHFGKDALDIFDDELTKFIENPIPKRELDKAKNMLLTSIVHDVSSLHGKCSTLTNHELLFGNAHTFFDLSSRYENVTEDNVKECVQQYLFKNNRTIIHVTPESNAV